MRWACVLGCLAAHALAATFEELNGKGEVFLTRPYVGTFMPLGTLYNAASELPVGGLYAPPEVIAAHRTVTPSAGVTLKYSDGDTWSDRCDLLDISAHFSLKVSSYEVSGSAALLSQEDNDAEEVRVSMSSTATFETEMLRVFDEGSLASIRSGPATIATHVVTGVVWGHRTVARFALSYKNDFEKLKVGGSLSAKMRYMIFTGTLGVSLQIGDEEHDTELRIRSEIYHDGIPASMPNMSDVVSVVEHVKGAYKEAAQQTSADGAPAGVPVYYHLTALKDLTPNSARALVAEIESDVVRTAEDIVGELSASDALVAALLREDAQGYLLWTARVDGYSAAFRRYSAALRTKFSELLTLASYGHTYGLADLKARVDAHRTGQHSAAAVARWVGDRRGEIATWRHVADALRVGGVHVASTARAVTRAALGVGVDASYLLVLVDGADGEFDYNRVRPFARMARSRLVDPGDTSSGHCTLAKLTPNTDMPPDGTNLTDVTAGEVGLEPVCRDSMSMTAMHFDSFCSSLCPSRFCLTPWVAHGTGMWRACPGRLGAGGACALSRSEQCWRRPQPDEGGRHSGAFDPVMSDAWCACPTSTLIMIQNTANGTDEIVEYLPVPATPVIVDVVLRPSAVPSAQGIDVFFEAEPEGGGAYYEVSVIWDCTACGGGAAKEMFRTATGGLLNDTVPIEGLRAGTRYRLQATSVNDFGRSAPSDIWYDVVVREPVLMVAAEEWVRGDGARHPFPRGPIDGVVPSWAVGGGDFIILRVTVSSEMKRPLRALSFEEVHPPHAVPAARGMACEDITFVASAHVKCRVPLAALTVDDPEAFDADRAFAVTGYDHFGGAVASGEVRWAAAGPRACGLFEALPRVPLCEGRVLEIEADGDDVDPLAQAVTISLGFGSYEREAFRGWEVVVDPLRKTEGQRVVKVPPRGRNVSVELLRAGGRYHFTLRALHLNGTHTPAAPRHSPVGYQVAEPAVIVTTLALSQEERPLWRNRVPGWAVVGGVRVAVELTDPGTALVDRVVFRGANGSEAACRSPENQTVAGMECTMATAVNKGGVPGEFGELVQVTAYNQYGEALANGTIERQRLTDDACADLVPWAPHRCSIDAGLDRCVVSCDDCTLPYRQACVPASTCEWKATPNVATCGPRHYKLDSDPFGAGLFGDGGHCAKLPGGESETDMVHRCKNTCAEAEECAGFTFYPAGLQRTDSGPVCCFRTATHEKQEGGENTCFEKASWMHKGKPTTAHNKTGVCEEKEEEEEEET